MNVSPLPRYLRIAHWMHEQQQFFSSEDIAKQFGLPIKRVSDDFAIIRQRQGIIELNEVREIRNGIWWRLINVISIHDYVLDARQYPHRMREKQHDKSEVIANTWRELLSTHWGSTSFLMTLKNRSNT